MNLDPIFVNLGSVLDPIWHPKSSKKVALKRPPKRVAKKRAAAPMEERCMAVVPGRP